MKHTKCYIAGHPRPQFVRKDWKSLNGTWKFAFGEEVNDAAAKKVTLRAPFAFLLLMKQRRAASGILPFMKQSGIRVRSKGKRANVRFCISVAPIMRRKCMSTEVLSAGMSVHILAFASM